MSKRLKTMICELEKSYPTLHRIDWSAIDSNNLTQSINANMDEIQNQAQFKLLTPEIILAELSLKPDDEQFKFLKENPELLEKVINVD